jgi:hypothetical protein
MRRNVNLSGREFSSLTKAKDHAKSILNKCDVGNKVSDDEKSFLLSAIALRGQEKLAEKIGAGVDYIFVDFNEAGDKAFYIHRVDGTEADFSYIKCFGHRSAITDFAQACRNAVKKEKAGLKTGLGYDTYHVHHEDKTFKSIVQAFVKEQQIDLAKVEYVEGDSVEGRFFKDPVMSELFRNFHSRRASMKVVLVEDHKKLHRRP